MCTLPGKNVVKGSVNCRFNYTTLDHLCLASRTHENNYLFLRNPTVRLRESSSSTMPRNFSVFGQIALAYKQCIKPCDALWRIAASKPRWPERPKEDSCCAVQKSEGYPLPLLTIDQSEICQRKGKPSPCGNATSQQTTTSTVFLSWEIMAQKLKLNT